MRVPWTAGRSNQSTLKDINAEYSSGRLTLLLELTAKEDVPFILGDWNAKVGSQEIPGVIG